MYSISSLGAVSNLTTLYGTAAKQSSNTTPSSSAEGTTATTNADGSVTTTITDSSGNIISETTTNSPSDATANHRDLNITA